MKRFSILTIVMLIIVGAWGSAFGQTGEEPTEKAIMNSPVMGAIESDEDFVRAIDMMGDKVAALEKAPTEDSNSQALKELSFFQYLPLLVRLEGVKDKEKRESLRQVIVNQFVRAQRLGAVKREPELKGDFSKADVKKRIYKILTGSPTGMASFATITEDGKPWVRIVQITVDKDLNIKIGTDKNSRKVSHIEKNPDVHICFYNQSVEGEIEYVQIQGRAEVSEDLELKKSIWNPMGYLYGTGPDDPNSVVITVKPSRAELWNIADLKNDVKPVAVWEP